MINLEKGRSIKRRELRCLGSRGESEWEWFVSYGKSMLPLAAFKKKDHDPSFAMGSVAEANKWR